MATARSASAIALTMAVMAGCASFHPVDAGSVTPAGRIVTEEMIAAYSVANAWEVLRKVGGYRTSREDGPGYATGIRSGRGRSSFLLTSADIPKIFIDGASITDFRYLRDLPASSIAWIQIMNGMDGTLFEGTNSGAGVIHIVTKVGR